jgi:DNA-binding phage protein
MTAERDASIVECHRLGLGHAQIARDFGLTRERVRQIIKHQLGACTPLKLQPAMRRSMALQALHQLETGSPCAQVAQQWDLSGEQLERILREQIGLSRQAVEFQGWMASQLGQRFGDWVVLAIEPHVPGSTSTMRCRVTARCERCGTVHRLGYRNLANGTSTMCHRCSCKHRHQGAPVRDLLSGAVYPSLKAAAAAQGLSYQQAQWGLRRPQQTRFARLNQPGPAPSPGAH